MSIRTDKVQSTIKHEISLIIQRDLSDPRLGFVTITDVHVSNDLQHATIYVSVLGDEAAHESSLHALERASGFIHNQLSRRLHLKRIPTLLFRMDTSLEKGARIFELLHQVENEPHPQETE